MTNGKFLIADKQLVTGFATMLLLTTPLKIAESNLKIIDVEAVLCAKCFGAPHECNVSTCMHLR